jgi:RNA polymerase sigma-70 factor (ECF subfamily)
MWSVGARERREANVMTRDRDTGEVRAQRASGETDAIQRCQQGDIAGLEPLVMAYQTPGLRLAYLLTGDHDLAEDITQESFLLAWRGIKRFRLGEPFAPWFYRIVTNTARQQRRSARYRREVSLEALGGDDSSGSHPWPIVESLRSQRDDPATRAEQTETRNALLAALATLPYKQREAVTLRYLIGYTDQQISDLLGCRLGAAQQRLHAGRASLRLAIRRDYSWLLSSLSTTD